MELFYSLGLSFLRTAYWTASWFSPKAKAFLRGRKDQRSKWETFELLPGEKSLWVHCASLGEFEQGRPVIEALKQWDPSLKIILTFFSPSGFEVRKNYEHADAVFYLPWDGRQNAKAWVEHVNPSLAIFVKYEFWYFYAKELNAHKIPLISLSSIFRPQQIFFKSHGTLFRKLLGFFSHFFVQNQMSVQLLQSIGITSVTVAGDSRFDRVFSITKEKIEIPYVPDFKSNRSIMVIGSAWPEDMSVLYPFINAAPVSMKFIVAPHEINEEFLVSIEKFIKKKTVRYTKAMSASLTEADVMIIDNIGMLSRLYHYGDYAFVGGAYRQGLHNILEPACFGIPVFFGSKAYAKYEEAVELIARGGAFAVSDTASLTAAINKFVAEPELLKKVRNVSRLYVNENLGATDKVMEYCKKILA